MEYESAPAEVLDRLRIIDPTADLVRIGEGHWVLGSWPSPFTTHHIMQAKAVLGTLIDNPEIWPTPMRTEMIRWYRFVSRGFRPIHEFTEVRDFEDIVLWFRRQEWLYRSGALHRNSPASRQRTSKLREDMQEYLQLEAAKDWRWIFKRRRFPGVVNQWSKGVEA